MDCLPDPTSWTPRTLDKGPPALTGDQAGETPPLKGQTGLGTGTTILGPDLKAKFSFLLPRHLEEKTGSQKPFRLAEAGFCNRM